MHQQPLHLVGGKTKVLTKEDVLIRKLDGTLIPKDINVGTEENPEYIKMTPLVFGEILKLGKLKTPAERETMIIKLLSEHLVEPQLTVEEILESDNVLIQKFIGAMNELSQLK
jgi:hypothetical protein